MDERKLIYADDAIRWIKIECNPYGKPTLDFESGKKVIEYLKRLPSVQPEHLVKESGNLVKGIVNDCISRQSAIDSVCEVCENCEYFYNEKLIQTIKNLPSAQRWIPVTERLPEYGAEVLTINTDGDYEINHIIDEEDAEWFFDGVIAWLPLPEPYKEKQDD